MSGLFPADATHGVTTAKTIANPAAGAGATVLVPAGQTWRVRSLVATLTTGAAVANRQPVLYARTPVPVLFALAVQPVVTPATTATTYFWQLGSGPQNVGAGGQEPCGLWDLVLPNAWGVQLACFNLQAADQWSAITLVYELWRG